jgi:hypothetical protein
MAIVSARPARTLGYLGLAAAFACAGERPVVEGPGEDITPGGTARKGQLMLCAEH